MNKTKFKERIIENLHDIYAYNLSSEEINKLASDIIYLNTFKEIYRAEVYCFSFTLK